MLIWRHVLSSKNVSSRIFIQVHTLAKFDNGDFFLTGYTGDGHNCVDIDECQDPVLAGTCVENAECCNLPAHFVCKCKEGFEGDGQKECRGTEYFKTCGTQKRRVR